jgi:hypothetical protein
LMSSTMRQQYGLPISGAAENHVILKPGSS